MKNILKVLTILLVLVTIPISIYYGLRALNTPYTYTYTNNSIVVTLPNKIWFEFSGTKDTLDEDNIFETEIPQVEKSGYDIGLQYPKYSIYTPSNVANKTQKVSRKGNTLNISLEVDIQKRTYEKYVQYIYFSQYGDILNGIYRQDGCNVGISSQNGKIIWNEENASASIEYDAKNMVKIKDNIEVNISCYER